ncbi:MAG: hypothetical protein Q8J68_07840 [Methanolobus sp.]|uniref:hypothetical protein n=1 Tax=Methanolobus sp. TaxID=1874737 RepID=UPI0027309CCE|nr:hypothetical protein [Methanolobus sp.]MDP2217179.1 hypothetical protein [Methanolobus sp.]
MVSEELLMVERLGIGGAAFVLVYLLLRKMQDRFFSFAENTIKENTSALRVMHEALMQHMKQKEPIVADMKECRRDRDETLRRIEEKLKLT